MNAKATSKDEDNMPAEIDFSGGVRGKYYRPGMQLKLPVYLDNEVREYLTKLAATKGVEVSDVANELLKREIAAIEAAK